MKHLLTPMIFFSAYRADLPTEINQQRHMQLCRDLERLHRAYIEVAGSYDGKLEQSVAIQMVDVNFYQHWALYAKKLGQESIMIRHADGSCYLVYCDDGHEEYIGQWREISAESAQSKPAWSRIRGRFYTAI